MYLHQYMAGEATYITHLINVYGEISQGSYFISFLFFFFFGKDVRMFKNVICLTYLVSLPFLLMLSADTSVSLPLDAGLWVIHGCGSFVITFMSSCQR